MNSKPAITIVSKVIKKKIKTYMLNANLRIPWNATLSTGNDFKLEKDVGYE